MVQDMLKGQADAMKEILKEQPIGRLGHADEIAAAVLWLCSPGASFVVGVGLSVDGGLLLTEYAAAPKRLRGGGTRSVQNRTRLLSRKDSKSLVNQYL